MIRPSVTRRRFRTMAAAGSLLFAICGARAQQEAVPAPADTIALTLADCIRMAQMKGPPGMAARLSYEAKKFRYDSFTASFLPQLSLRGDLPGYYRSINTVILPDGTSIFTPQSQASSSVDLVLSQKIPFTGADLSLSSGLNRIDILDSHSQYYRSSPFTVSLRQPIFRINSMNWDRKEEQLRDRIADREVAEAMEDVAVEITNRFFEFDLAAMNAANAATNLANNDTLYNISRGRFNVGRIAENDLLQSELAFLNAQTELENAVQAYARAQAALRIALGLPPGQVIEAVPPEEVPAVRIDSGVALAHARRNRSDMLAFDLRRLSADRSVEQARSDNLFSATMSASLGFNQRSPVLREAYRNLLDQQQFTVSLDVPLFRWGAGSNAIDAAEVDRRATQVAVDRQVREFEEETRDEVARLNLLRAQVAVAAKADTIARRRFEVAKDRYLIGKIDIPNLFLAQQEKDNAARSRIQTLWNYWRSYYRVRRLTLYDFVADRPIAGPP